jgi:K+-sensing histidine kinase KdpD
VFLYNPPPAAKRAREIDESVVGVLLYRDGLLVEPYGIDEDDWLGVRARKAQRQGHAAIQPDTFFGHVLITRRRNRALRDQTNRLGLLESSESENFLDHVRAEFRAFEELVYHEVVEQRWESKSEKAAKRARESQELSIVFLRSLAHAIRQPLQGLGWEVVSLEELSERGDLPDDARDALRGIAERTGEHIGLAEKLITPLLSQSTPEFAETSADAIVEEAVAQNRLLIRSLHASVEVAATPAIVLVPGPLVVQALAAVIANAIEAPRPEAVEPKVSIAVVRQSGDVVVSVSDNGTGIERDNGSISAIESTKGRPAAGLRSAELALTAARGRLELVDAGSSGTTFELRLPTKVKGLSR